MIKLDERDLMMLSVLQREGRITKTALAERVNLSPSPCWERLQRLEKAGIIEGYGALISTGVFTNHTFVFMEASLQRHKAGDLERFESAIQSMDEVLECWAVGGGLDYLLKIIASSVDDYQCFVERMLNADIGLEKYDTYVVTKRIKETSIIPDFLLQSLLKS